MKKHALPFLIAAALAPLPAAASSSDWVDTQGGRLRLVTADHAEADGTLRAALEIDLLPGWKTYWRDPGDAGVPPTITLDAESDVSGVDVAFPVPERFHDGETAWAGYKEPVALALTFTGARPDGAGHVAADVFLGICEDICIPVQARFDVDTRIAAATTEDDLAVAAAFDALPEQASAEFRVTPAEGGGGDIVVEAHVPDGLTPTDLFLAGGDGYYLAQPETVEKDGRWFYAVKMLEGPAARPNGVGLHYTLIAGDRAVSGFLPYP